MRIKDLNLITLFTTFIWCILANIRWEIVYNTFSPKPINLDNSYFLRTTHLIISTSSTLYITKILSTFTTILSAKQCTRLAFNYLLSGNISTSLRLWIHSTPNHDQRSPWWYRHRAIAAHLYLSLTTRIVRSTIWKM